MRYNIMPHVGILKYAEAGTISARLQFPAKEAKTS